MYRHIVDYYLFFYKELTFSFKRFGIYGRYLEYKYPIGEFVQVSVKTITVKPRTNYQPNVYLRIRFDYGMDIVNKHQLFNN